MTYPANLRPILVFTVLSSIVLLLPPLAREAHPRLLPLEETARAYLLVDTDTGEVLRAKNPHEALIPASLTKVMALRVAFRALREGRVGLQDSVTVSVRAWGFRPPLRGTSLIFLQPGKPATVEQLIEGMAVASGNDASVALAEHIAGSVTAFVEMMNQEAERLGLRSARFYDPHGLSPQNRISGADMLRLALATMRDYPEILDYASRPSITYNDITQYNNLRLVGRFEGVDGLKTGFLSASGFNVVATAKRGDRRLMTVVMGTPRRINGQRGGHVRDRLASELLTMGFESLHAATN